MQRSSDLFKLIITATADSSHVLILIAERRVLWQEQLPVSHLLILTATPDDRGHAHKRHGLLILQLRGHRTLHCMRPLRLLSRWCLGLLCRCHWQGMGDGWWGTGSCGVPPLVGAAV